MFANGAERWVVDRGDNTGYGVRFDGTTMPPRKRLILNRDEFGGKVFEDVAESKGLRDAPVKKREWKRKQKRTEQ